MDKKLKSVRIFTGTSGTGKTTQAKRMIDGRESSSLIYDMSRKDLFEFRAVDKETQFVIVEGLKSIEEIKKVILMYQKLMHRESLRMCLPKLILTTQVAVKPGDFDARFMVDVVKCSWERVK